MKQRKVPPCGRLIEYREPHSPFQKLIDGRRKRFGLSCRDLSEQIGVPQSSLWIWLHNLNGFPHPKSFKPEHLTKISEVLKIPEAELKSALDTSRNLFTSRTSAVPHEAFDPFVNFISILENDPRRHMSKNYVLNLPKNLYNGVKVTLCVLSAIIAFQIVSSLADDPQTLVTVGGKRYEKVRVTEVTPVTIAFTHSVGVARVPFTDFGPDVQKKYGYDESKARTWLMEQAEQAAKLEKATHDVEREKREQALRNMEAVETFCTSLGPGELRYDPITKQIYNGDREAEIRGELLREALKQKYLSGGQPLQPSPAPH